MEAEQIAKITGYNLFLILFKFESMVFNYSKIFIQQIKTGFTFIMFTCYPIIRVKLWKKVNKSFMDGG